ncbi:hypothetical protein M409DRAFT_28586 [Zasmidium cellare ATCC 36951]|uniref:DUF7605 domain-containing protein n=1 Tax=Zasmidium cellare ATCC 36951 TaxID=1080233 RepID=A0A6A6C474_ZASCE|nr:uncharacterized protein M409DRAFT_28586 [Zasmidium cellare ATCC 36951]KAF2160980.1 hypothetical protein M409DRAFT_28586 [Zasmidium cellare ATCC 36951]
MANTNSRTQLGGERPLEEYSDVGGGEKHTINTFMDLTLGDDQDVGGDDKADETMDTISDAEEDESDEETGYCEKMEALPTCAAFDSGTPKVKAKLVELADKANDLFECNSCTSPDAERLYNKLNKVRTIPEPERKMIGLIGNAGQGKSSCINSINDISKLAKAVSAGKSVTFVVSLYEKVAASQKHDFSARIEYFDIEAVKKMLEDAIMDFQAYFNEADKNWDNEEKKNRKKRAMTTVSLFRAVFCDLTNFRTDGDAERWLNELCSFPNEVEEKAQGFVDLVEGRMNSRFGDSERVIYQDAMNQHDLRSWLDPNLSEDNVGEEPLLWPFVKQVRIGVRGSRMLDHWTLADLPGVTDTNQVRVDATLNHIRQCDHLWIFDDVARIVTNGNVVNHLDKYGKMFKDNFAVIATKCDEGVDTELVREMTRNSRALKYCPDLAEREERWEDINGALKDKISRLSRKKQKKSKTSASPQEGDPERLQRSLKKTDDEWWELIVNARNHAIGRELWDACRKCLPPTHYLKVFAISNTQYESLKSGDGRAYFQLSAKGTGIPKLRVYYLSAAAQPFFQSLLNFVNHDFGVFIEGCKLFVRNDPVEGRNELISVTKDAQQKIQTALNDYSREVRMEANRKVFRSLRANQRQYTLQAWEIVDDTLSSHAWATLKVFIRHHGNHSTPAMPDKQWNVLFTEQARGHVVQNWESYIPDLKQKWKLLEGTTFSELESIFKLLKSKARHPDSPMHTFAASLESRTNGVRETFTAAEESLEGDLRRIYNDATVDGPTNFFMQAMVPAYVACKKISGNGCRDRWLEVLKDHLAVANEGTPFEKLADLMQAAINAAVLKQVAQLQESIDKTLTLILEDFASGATEVEQSDAEEGLREDLKDWLPGVIQEYDICRQMLREVRKRCFKEIFVD